ncbi:putative intimin [Escherichia coli]|uniref:Putative intimin n=1 Tax=Escherichia coli TaxID=562 RepID=A0A376WAD2_ECOLX|nr:putative intimin [Escherichia coli]
MLLSIEWGRLTQHLIGKDKNRCRLTTFIDCLWRDNNKDGVFQQVEKLTDEEMAQYDYKWEFTGKSINGEVDAQANTSNEDIVIPATNREAAQTYGAQAGDGLQGYGLRVLYTKK